MTTVYAACLARLGLSMPEASRFHDVRLDTVKSWASGRNRPPASVFDELRALETRIIDRSEQMREEIEIAQAAQREAPDRIDIDLSEANHLSAMAAADFILGLEGINVVDGKTEATIAARTSRRLVGE